MQKSVSFGEFEGSYRLFCSWKTQQACWINTYCPRKMTGSCLSTLGRTQPSSWLGHETGMQLLVPSLAERKCSWRRGKWQLGKEGCLGMTLCSSLTPACHFWASVAEMLFPWQGWVGGKSRLSVKMNRGRKRKFVQRFDGRLMCFSGDIKEKRICT